MARGPRRKSRVGIYHVMLRGVNRQTIFEDDEDKLRFLDTVKRFKAKCNFKLYCYCLMENHIHLLIKETDESISKTMQRISASYVYWYNQKYDRIGHLFQGRYKSEIVETASYFKTVLRYIHQNPIKAGISTNVFDCKWTSMNEYTSTGVMVDIDLGLNVFSLNRKKAFELFYHYMQQPNDDECLDDYVLPKITDDEIREYLSKIGIPSRNTLQQMEQKDRNEIILKLKNLNGATIRQLSRITGISKSVIQRIQ